MGVEQSEENVAPGWIRIGRLALRRSFGPKSAEGRQNILIIPAVKAVNQFTQTHAATGQSMLIPKLDNNSHKEQFSA